MYTVYINEQNLLSSPYVLDANLPIDVTDDIYQTICVCPFGRDWYYNEDTETFELITSQNNANLRFARSQCCFPIIDRSYAWYSTLTSAQQQELSTWYKAWLDVTNTKVLPEQPSWLD